MSFAEGLQLHHFSKDQPAGVYTSFNLHSVIQVFSRTTALIICYRIRRCPPALFFHIDEVILHIIVRAVPRWRVDHICGFCSESVHLHGCLHFNTISETPATRLHLTRSVDRGSGNAISIWLDTCPSLDAPMITWKHLGIIVIHMGSSNEADSFLGHMSLMTTSRCNVQRQIHICSQKQHIGAAANDLVNLPYQWCINFPCAFWWCNIPKMPM